MSGGFMSGGFMSGGFMSGVAGGGHASIVTTVKQGKV